MSFQPFKTALSWARKVMDSNYRQGYDPLQIGNGTGWIPEDYDDSEFGGSVNENLSSEDSFISLQLTSAHEVSPPPKVILGKYTFVSTIAQDNIHLYQSAVGKEFVVVKNAPFIEADNHRRVAGNYEAHPNLAQYINTATLEGQPLSNGQSPNNVLLLMEYANSGSWQRLVNFALKNNFVLPATFCWHVLSSVLSGLIHMQSTHGMMHMDAHLGNVTFDMKKGRVRCMLIDFEASFILHQENWETSLSPSFSLTAREILRNREAFPQDFVHIVSFAAKTETYRLGLETLRELRDLSLAKAGGLETTEDGMPNWLGAYFASAAG